MKKILIILFLVVTTFSAKGNDDNIYVTVSSSLYGVTNKCSLKKKTIKQWEEENKYGLIKINKNKYKKNMSGVDFYFTIYKSKENCEKAK